jgi:glycolate oxidase FAD binding subunit
LPEEAPITINGVRADLQVRPADEGDLREILTDANDSGRAVYFCGGATKLEWGNTPQQVDLLVELGSTRGFSELDPDNLTLAAGAGTPIWEVAAQARAIGRILPLDPGTPEQATVGGVVATADQGARGAGYGGIRDVVLGMKAVLADGTPVRFGGRTVKNVTGYDLTRLFVGSFGVLGVITEVTFRLVPRPSTQAVVALPLESLDQAARMAARVIGSCLCPLCVEVVSAGFAEMLGALPAGAGVAPAATGGAAPLAGAALLDAAAAGSEGWGGCVLVIGFAGNRAAVARSLADVEAVYRGESYGGGPVAPWWDDGAETVYVALAEARAAAAAAGLQVAARAVMPISEVWHLAGAARAMWPGVAPTEESPPGDRPGEAPLVYRIGATRGTLDLFVRANLDAQALSTFLEGLRRQAAPAGGHLVVTQGLTRLTPGFDAWGASGPSLRVMKALKERFDPHGTLNRGRFVGGI